MRKHRMCSDFNRMCSGLVSYSTRHKAGCEENPRVDTAAAVLVTSSAFLVPVCTWPCWLETLHHIQERYQTHLLLPWDAGNVGAMALGH